MIFIAQLKYKHIMQYKRKKATSYGDVDNKTKNTKTVETFCVKYITDLNS